MFKNLNPAQRFLGMFALVFLASTLALTAASWPRSDPAVVADLRAPDCAYWRQIPPEKIPAVEPEQGKSCYAIRSFLYRERTVIGSESDYASYRFATGIRKGLTFLGIWAGFIGTLYVLALAGLAMMRLLTRKGPKLG